MNEFDNSEYAEPKIAKGYSRLGLDFEHFIQNFTAPGHQEPIRVFTSVPYVDKEEIKGLVQAHQAGDVRSYLKKMHSTVWTWPVFEAAVTAFFTQTNLQPYFDEEKTK